MRGNKQVQEGMHYHTPARKRGTEIHNRIDGRQLREQKPQELAPPMKSIVSILSICKCLRLM
jgi:hypothetical protein